MVTKRGRMMIYLEGLSTVVLQGHVPTKNISTTRVPMANKLGRIITYLDGLLPAKSHDPSST